MNMSELVRFCVSLEKGLLKKFDRHIKQKKYPNRSEAFRDLIRRELIGKEWQSGREVAGAITLIYDHHRRELLNKLTDIQHDFQNIVISAQHVHLDHDNSLELILIKGKIREVLELESKMKSIKGVMHSALARSTLGRDL